MKADRRGALRGKVNVYVCFRNVVLTSRLNLRGTSQRGRVPGVNSSGDLYAAWRLEGRGLGIESASYESSGPEEVVSASARNFFQIRACAFVSFVVLE